MNAVKDGSNYVPIRLKVNGIKNDSFLRTKYDTESLRLLIDKGVCIGNFLICSFITNNWDTFKIHICIRMAMFCFIHHITHKNWICLKIYDIFPTCAYFFIHSTVQSRRMSCLSCLIGFFCFHCQNSIPNLQHPLDIYKIFVGLKTHVTYCIKIKYVSQAYRVTIGKGSFAYQYQFTWLYYIGRWIKVWVWMNILCCKICCMLYSFIFRA